MIKASSIAHLYLLAFIFAPLLLLVAEWCITQRKGSSACVSLRMKHVNIPSLHSFT